MTNEVSSPTDWKEVSITAGVTLATAFLGCLIAVVVAQTLIIPAINSAKDKKALKAKEDKKTA